MITVQASKIFAYKSITVQDCRYFAKIISLGVSDGTDGEDKLFSPCRCYDDVERFLNACAGIIRSVQRHLISPLSHQSWTSPNPQIGHGGVKTRRVPNHYSG